MHDTQFSMGLATVQPSHTKKAIGESQILTIMVALVAKWDTDIIKDSGYSRTMETDNVLGKTPALVGIVNPQDDCDTIRETAPNMFSDSWHLISYQW